MRALAVFLAATALAVPAKAADRILTGAIPAWVSPASPPTPAKVASEVPVQVLLLNLQAYLEPGQSSIFTRQQIRIGTADGLSAGNISLRWRPDKDTLTVHSLRILRGDQQIDVLAAGQSFSILRREANLENAMLDGVLTGNLQPEGLQVGDILDISFTMVTRDPVLADTAELVALAPQTPVSRMNLAVQWPSTMKVRSTSTGGLPPLRITQQGDRTGFRFSMQETDPPEIPKDAPVRFAFARRIELTSFADWSDVGALLAPLYARAAVIPASGPLRQEVDKIRVASPDPIRRAELALALVQERIRYVALSMGDGGLVPEAAETTWTRRFGDCKAKTALLLAILKELDIPAVPVAVHSVAGDGLNERLPMVGQFDHVLVRAEIGGKSYWLDGTRLGDSSLQRLVTPAYHWGVELVPQGGKLVRILPQPLTVPVTEASLELDATAGLSLPVKAHAQLVSRGDTALMMNRLFSQVPAGQKDAALREVVKKQFPKATPQQVSSTFDRATGEFRIKADGIATLDWKNGIALDSDIGRKLQLNRPAGPMKDAPLAIAYPLYNRSRETIRLPADFVAQGKQQFRPIAVTLAGVEYRRIANWTGNSLTVEASERSLVPEVPYATAIASAPELTRLAQEQLILKVPSGYRTGEKELATLSTLKLDDEDALLERSYELIDGGKFDAAIKDLDTVLAKNPKNATALANRGLAYVWLQNGDKAERDLSAAEAIDAQHPVIHRARGLRSGFEENYADAVKHFTRAIELDADNAFAFAYRALAYARLKDQDRALADSARALELSKDWPQLQFLRADIFRERGDKERALAEVASLLDSSDSGIQLGLAELYRALGRWPDAEKALAKAMVKENGANMLLRRAQLRPLEDRAGRRADLQAFLKKEPTSPAGIAALGELMEQDGDYAGAIKLYSRGIAALSEGYRLRTRRGVALIRLGRTAEGRRDIAAGLPPTPRASNYNERCWLLATSGLELERALADCTAGLKLKPGHGPLLDSRGLVYLRMGKLDLALSDYNQAVDKNRTAASFMGRSLVLRKMGDTAKADADRKAAENLQPDIVALFKTYGL